MKKSLLFICMFIVFFAFQNTVHAQLGGVLNKVKNKAIDKVLGKPETTPETNDKNIKKDPDCACSDAKQILSLSEGVKIDYKECSFSVTDDGKILFLDKLEGKYYTVKDGIKLGPFDENDPVVKQFDSPEYSNEQNKIEDLMARYKGIIVPSGDKYSIKFNGKTYGPYAIIQSFMHNHSKTKFAAIVIQDVILTESQGKSMEEKMKNAKTDQERMALSMEMSQQVQQKMMNNGGNMDMMPKMVSNIPGAKYDMSVPGAFSAKVKYDEIVLLGYDRISDLTGKTLKIFDPQKINSSAQLWLSADNSRLATFDMGTLNLSDDKICTEIFSPILTKIEGKIYITYMYFSPENNAIMQCKLPF